MAHLASLRDYKFQNRADDIRGCDLHGVNNEKLGTIDDVIFEHGGGEIKYAVVDTGSMRSKKFLVPADRIHEYDRDRDALQVDLVKEHIERYFPPYDDKMMGSDREFRDYRERYDRSMREHQVWDNGPVLHREGSNRILTPEAEEMPAPTGSGEDLRGYDVEPQRLQGKFPETMPGSGKISMAPAGTRNEQRLFATGNEAMPSREMQDFSRFTGKPITSDNTPETLDEGGPQEAFRRAEQVPAQHEHGHEGATADIEPQGRERMHHRHQGKVEEISTSPEFNPDRDALRRDLRGSDAPIANVAGRDLDTRNNEIPVDEPGGPGPVVRDSRMRDNMRPPNRWQRFEDLLRKNRVDIEAKCPSCAPAKDKDKDRAA